MPARTRDRLPPSQRQYVAQPLPEFLEFQHPRLVDRPPAGDQWLHEAKLDGYRLQVRVERGAARVLTRRGHDWTDQLPQLAQDAADLDFEGILDGELCYLDPKSGQPVFSGLRAHIGRGDTAALVFYAFDLLWRGQDDLRRFALRDRKDILAEVMADAPSPRIRQIQSLPPAGPALLAAACRMGLEGIVSKRRDSRYEAGRPDTWVKSKCRLEQEFVVGGWTQEPGRAFKGVMLGVYEGERLRYVGTVERGFSTTPGLAKAVQASAAKASPFGLESPRKTREVNWARPQLVVNVAFQEWTDSQKIRHASLTGVRDDKDPREVVRERPETNVL